MTSKLRLFAPLLLFIAVSAGATSMEVGTSMMEGGCLHRNARTSMR
jgi:hypothetical protein